MVPYSEFAKNDGTTATDAIGASSSRNGAHSLYIDSNGSVWSVGDNTSSQLDYKMQEIKSMLHK